MNQSDPRQAELEELFTALELGALSEPQRTRLNELLGEDEVLDIAVDHLEVWALLRWHHGAVPGSEAPAPEARNGWLPGLPILLSAAAALLLLTPLVFWLWTPETQELGAPGTTQVTDLDSGWRIQPTGTATFQVTGPGAVRLTRGELRVRSMGASTQPLSIKTPLGEARATGTEFFVGTHTQRERESHTMRTPTRLTRVLVLSGAVTLTNALGTATARAGELVAAPQGGAPTNVVAQSGGDFGFDVYRQLAAKRKDQNLFFSPYSITNVLTMAAEGARGQTAEEMGRVLHWPAAARRVGDDAQKIPFELARIHSGYEELNRLFNAGQTPEQQKLQKRLQEITTELIRLTPGLRKARANRDRETIRKINRQMRPLFREHDRLAGQVKSYRLSVANAVWGDKSHPFSKSYLDTIRSAYDTGSVVEADFKNNPGREVDRINAWVRKHTESRIRQIVDRSSVTTLTRLVLLNAIYFKGEWLTPFDKRMTRPGPFTTSAGSKVQTPMMRHYDLQQCRYGAFAADGSFFPSPKMIDAGQKEGLYPEAGGFQVLELPYRGGDLTMVVLLPVDTRGLSGVEKKLSSARLESWLKKLETRKTNVRMPRFKAETSYDLAGPLRELGMVRALDRKTGPDGADFSGMTKSTNPDEQLYVQAILHKAFVSVDEKGTEAAAVTGMAVGAKAAPRRIPFKPYFNADRPFLYLIRDTRSGTILFLGRMVKP